MQEQSDHLHAADVTDRLRSVGLRATRQRVSLARILLRGGPRHISAEALHEEAEAAGISVSLATIYNTLNQFAEAGLIRRLIALSDPAYFDTNPEPHHHFYDVEKGRLTDMPAEAVKLLELPEVPYGMQIEDVEVVVRVRRRQG